MKKTMLCLSLLGLLLVSTASIAEEKDPPRLSMFIGVDVSGSFLKSPYFDDSLNFLSQYIHDHLEGKDDLDQPRVLFIGSLGGMKRNEPKTFYPIQAFEHKSVAEIKAKLQEIFPKTHEDAYTDFNSFFEQVENTVKNKGLILRPLSIVLLSDGIPDFPGKENKHDVSRINLKPLELLSRNITVRLLYTNATIAHDWQSKIKRQRVKVWTQDAVVMTMWKEPKIQFTNWLKDNVDFPVRMRRVD